MNEKQAYLKNVKYTESGAIIPQPTAGYPQDTGINWLNVIISLLALVIVIGIIWYVILIISTTH